MIKRALSVLRWISKRNWDLSGGGWSARSKMLTFNCKTAFEGCGCRRKVSRDVDRYRPRPPLFPQKNGTDDAIFYLFRWISSSRTVCEKFRKQQLGESRVKKFRLIHWMIFARFIFLWFNSWSRWICICTYYFSCQSAQCNIINFDIFRRKKIEFKLLEMVGIFG